ncbi:hypothetical protein DFH09DRAFT_1338009 [Mycena vulgaris]|nr:hypothetical protein DFH09DRAFT_1338009 [Mycena vulgaris]
MPSLFSRAPGRTASTPSKHKAQPPLALSPVPSLPRTDEFGRTRTSSLPDAARFFAPTWAELERTGLTTPGPFVFRALALDVPPAEARFAGAFELGLV